jgi:V/A-type H+-transporting ATPase subunit I
MITKMKKYDFLIYHKDYQDILLKLRELGVVHIVQKQLGAIAEESELAKLIILEKRYTNIIENLTFINIEHHIREHKEIDREVNGKQLLEYVESLFEEKEKLLLEKETILKEIERITPLGDFEPEDIHRLKENGWYVHIQEVTEAKFEPEWIDEYYAEKLGMNGSLLYFATFTKEPESPPIEADDFRLSEKSISNWKKDLSIKKTRIKEVEQELIKIAEEKFNTIIYLEKKVNDRIVFDKVELSGDRAAGEKLMILEGYVPEEKELQTTATLRNEAVYFNVSTPEPKDNPPIKLKNNRFAKAFELVANLYDKPNYHAFDLTPFFAPFYIIFFGLCMGDCGYGALIFLTSLFLRRSEKTFIRSAGRLASYLGIGAVIFGFVSGTFFGIIIPDLSFGWLQPLKGIILNDEQLFWFALIVGGAQIIYALIIKAITQWMRFGFFYSLDTFGWLLTILGNGVIFLLVSAGKLDSAYQSLAHYLITSAGCFLMFFFNAPQKGLSGIPGSVGTGLFGLYNKLSGLLGDILSYIRLFALGISGSVMGLVFNQIAIGFAPDVIVIRELVMILILLFGHSINIFISGLGSLIHPMRLTFVEFYKNAGFEGGGLEYLPFVKQAD